MIINYRLTFKILIYKLYIPREYCELCLTLRKGGLIMNSIYKPLILAVVVGVYVYIASKSDNNVIPNFVISYLIITIVYLLFRKIEEKRKRVRRR